MQRVQPQSTVAGFLWVSGGRQAVTRSELAADGGRDDTSKPRRHVACISQL